MSSLAIRTGVRAARNMPVVRQNGRQMVFKRYAHGDAPHEIFPFSWDKKRAFAVKCAVYMGTGFSIPFAAVWWQLHKHAGSA
ncbi:hypothetical protein D9613_009010 [Agrocybe pediades]|uniref:Cytochrome c oxidase subunit 8, mitochondrial n=1 Tax=Agrocybe pediades TaxID=84607 RepID=A0A8H4VTK3_9AGAR|nr:hypothetical protein D9613_009010 [Agrocybe pediades]KAF9558444.1 hypothetical protein CPC08DRAFT_763933 [Agrocybe pediades]